VGISGGDPNGPVSSRFRFRLVARGEQANALVITAVRSLRRCHPNVGIILVDANDVPTLGQQSSHAGEGFTIVHVTPEEDDIAHEVGRGSRQHLFYWRHSPQLLAALPATDAYDVHSDVDILFVRPMDLASLMVPLAKGRIAAAVDESYLDYHLHYETLAAGPAAAYLPAAGSGGPLLQGGLLFTNPADDGGFYRRFWDLAVSAAKSGNLSSLPWDDMCIITSILGHGGPLWERLLILGSDWNYITDASKEPGVFGRSAHYGGRKAQAWLRTQHESLFPSADGNEPCSWWGTVAVPGDSETPAFVRGPWRHRANAGDVQGPLSVPIPFALSRIVPDHVWTFDFFAAVFGTVPADAVFYIYVDGRLAGMVSPEEGRAQMSVGVTGAETVTVIGVSRTRGCHVHLYDGIS
jgi:hypothetical protein